MTQSNVLLKAHRMLNALATRPEYSEKSGKLTLVLFLNCGGIRNCKVRFESIDKVIEAKEEGKIVISSIAQQDPASLCEQETPEKR